LLSCAKAKDKHSALFPVAHTPNDASSALGTREGMFQAGRASRRAGTVMLVCRMSCEKEEFPLLPFLVTSYQKLKLRLASSRKLADFPFPSKTQLRSTGNHHNVSHFGPSLRQFSCPSVPSSRLASALFEVPCGAG
jgi:hypothetical protein